MKTGYLEDEFLMFSGHGVLTPEGTYKIQLNVFVDATTMDDVNSSTLSFEKLLPSVDGVLKTLNFKVISVTSKLEIKVDPLP